MSLSRPQVEVAADAILALINSRPTSPRQEEIAAIIAEATASSARDIYLGSAWRRALDRFVEEAARIADADGGVADAACEQINADIIVASQAIWARSCATFDDLVLRAAVATFWERPRRE
jgi:hypothetical protein